MKKRKIPLRKCIVTGEMKPKKELIRIVRTSDGEVAVDLTGKKNGRGAYISGSFECVEQARKSDILSRHLQVKVNSDIYDQLLDIIKRGVS